MKRCNLFLLLFFIPFCGLFAQMRRNAVMLSGQVQFNTIGTKSIQKTGNLSAAYFITPHFGVGIEATSSRISYAPFDNKGVTNNYSVFTKQLFPLIHGFYVFSKPWIQFAYTKSLSPNLTEKTHTFSSGLNIGFMKFLTPNLALEVTPFSFIYERNRSEKAISNSVFQSYFKEHNDYFSAQLLLQPQFRLDLFLNTQPEKQSGEKNFTDRKIVNCSFNYSSSKPTNIKETDFQINPSLFVFINNWIAGGIGVGYERSTIAYSPVDKKYSENQGSFTPFVRVYKWLNGSTGLYVSPYLNFSMSDIQNDPWHNYQQYFSYNLNPGINGGFTTFLTKRIVLEGSVSLISYEQKTWFQNNMKPINTQEKMQTGPNFNAIKLALGYAF